nr:hypothetical protein [Methanobrevibacter arboriphilus]
MDFKPLNKKDTRFLIEKYGVLIFFILCILVAVSVFLLVYNIANPNIFNDLSRFAKIISSLILTVAYKGDACETLFLL